MRVKGHFELEITENNFCTNKIVPVPIAPSFTVAVAEANVDLWNG